MLKYAGNTQGWWSWIAEGSNVHRIKALLSDFSFDHIGNEQFGVALYSDTRKIWWEIHVFTTTSHTDMHSFPSELYMLLFDPSIPIYLLNCQFLFIGLRYFSKYCMAPNFRSIYNNFVNSVTWLLIMENFHKNLALWWVWLRAVCSKERKR